MELERCCVCDQPTGKAGRADDSIYIEIGPLCDECADGTITYARLTAADALAELANEYCEIVQPGLYDKGWKLREALQKALRQYWEVDKKMKTIQTARYFNSNGVAVAIIAVANYFDECLFDWSTYIGGSTKVEREQDCIEEVANHGCKLSRNDAQYFFPHLPIEKYRE